MKSKRLYGLMGYPVWHSLSAFMHNAAFQTLDIDARYELFEVKPHELSDFLSSLSQRNIYGLNVTIPYKEKVLDFVSLDKDSFYARRIQAVNTIVRTEDGCKGFNTDAPGFLQHLKEQFEPDAKKAAVLGAGGAGRAVVYALAESKAKEIVIYDIDTNKANKLVEMIKNSFREIDIQCVSSIEQLDIKNKDLLVNATPVGMKDADPCLVNRTMLHKHLFVYDVIYNPPETKLLAQAKEAGAVTCNGLGMLLYQGMLSFEYWTGKKPPKEVMWQALISHIS